jgi:hypothetical protein
VWKNITISLSPLPPVPNVLVALAQTTEPPANVFAPYERSNYRVYSSNNNGKMVNTGANSDAQRRY